MALLQIAALGRARRAYHALRGAEFFSLAEFVDRFFVNPSQRDRRRFYDALFRSRCGVLLNAQASAETFIVDSADAFMSCEVFCQGSSQFDTVETSFRLIARELGVDLKEWTLIDIGANIGVISIPVIARGMCARAIAIEPTPRTARLLRANIALNGLEDRFAVYETALSDREGVAELELSEDNSGDNRLAVPAAENAYNEASRKKIMVPVRRFDDLFADLDMRRCLAWIDVQGFEGFVLAGGQKIVTNKTPMVLEFWPYGIRRINSLPLLLDALRPYDRFCVLSSFGEEGPGRFRPISSLPALWESVAAQNEMFGLDLLVL